jgi:hypothetical protein
VDFLSWYPLWGLILPIIAVLVFAERAAHYLHLSNPSYRAMLKAQDDERKRRRERRAAWRASASWPYYHEFDSSLQGWVVRKHRRFWFDRKVAGPYGRHTDAALVIEMLT